MAVQGDGAGRERPRVNHDAIGVGGAVGDEVRAVKVGDAVVMPFAHSHGRFGRAVGLDEVPDGYRAMIDRDAINGW